MVPERRRELWLWTLACGAGEFAGIAVAAGAIVITRQLVGEPVSASAKVVTLASSVGAGIVEGTLVGALQWSVLRTRFAVAARSWIGITAIVGASLWLLGMLTPTLMTQASEAATAAPPAAEPPWILQIFAGALGGSVAGAIFGTAQWTVLRRHAERPGRWIWANMAGWTVAMAWIFAAASSPPAGSSVAVSVALGAAGGILAGLSVGLVTGLFLVRIEATPPPEVTVGVPASAHGSLRRVPAAHER